MLTITKDFGFDASHRLNNPEWDEEKNKEVYGKCNNLPSHGHTYKLSVTLEGEPDESGMMINFTELKKIVNKLVIEPFDHHFIEHGGTSTCEIMVQEIFELLDDALAGPNYKLKRIDLYESIYPTNSYASYEG